MIFTALIVLLDIHFMYHIEYNPFVREVMEFFQEKLFLCLKEGKLALLIPTCYCSLSCVEDQLSSTSDNNMIDEGDVTQAFCELRSWLNFSPAIS